MIPTKMHEVHFCRGHVWIWVFQFFCHFSPYFFNVLIHFLKYSKLLERSIKLIERHFCRCRGHVWIWVFQFFRHSNCYFSSKGKEMWKWKKMKKKNHSSDHHNRRNLDLGMHIYWPPPRLVKRESWDSPKFVNLP